MFPLLSNHLKVRQKPIPFVPFLALLANIRIGLHHPLDGVTNPEYKLLRSYN